MTTQAANNQTLDENPVTALQDVLNARMREQKQVADLDAARHLESAEKLLRDMRIVKRARFNAHERLGAKHTVSVVMFALAGVAEVGLSVFSQVYEGKLNPAYLDFIGVAGIITAILLLVLGLVVGMLDYQTQAFHHQRCAFDLSDLSRELEIELTHINRAELQNFRRRYNEIITRCPYNHAGIDIERAWARNDDAQTQKKLTRRLNIDIYGLYVLGLTAYASFWATYWIFLAE